MKILITGAEGFLGSHLTERLASLNHKVKAFIMYNFQNSLGYLEDCEPKLMKNIEIFQGDVRDNYCIRNAMKNCDAVIHLAALIGIPYSYNSPSSYIETNIKGTLNILQEAKDLKIKRIIHTSTSEVYGSGKFFPMTEDHPLNGQSPYAATKIGADQIAMSFYRSFKTPVIILRPFNIYGPRQSARAVIPTIISQLLSGKKNIYLGSVYPTRDFTYVSDTVDAFVRALKPKNLFGQTINIGSNYEISIKKLVNEITKLMNKKITINFDKKRKRPSKSEVTRLRASNSKAKKLLKWKPKNVGLKGLKKGLLETVKWLKEEKNFRKYKHNIYNL